MGDVNRNSDPTPIQHRSSTAVDRVDYAVYRWKVETLGHKLLDDWFADSAYERFIDFANDAGISDMDFGHLRKRRRRASFRIAHAIELLTAGEVPMSSWMEPA